MADDSAMSREFTQAMRAGDWDRADRLIPDLAATLPDSLLRSIGELRIVQQRFGDAAEAFERMKYRNSDAEMNRKLCRNLACLSVHRPRLYQTLLESKSANCYTVKASITGHPTILFQKPDGNPISMSADNDPLKGVQTAMQSVDAAHRGGKALGLSGIGDGYLLLHLAQNPPELILGRQQAVCAIEPDAQLALTCLMIHDYTGPAGPIEQQRISWYIGENWLTEFRDDFFTDLFKMYPGITIRTGLHSVTIERELERFLKDIADLDHKLVAETQPYYQSLTREKLVEVMGENPPRKPRVLVMTTRFSTVLQYSAADTADAFGKLGWDVHFLIEPTAWHGLNRIAMRQAVAQFKPDLVFQIDHLRSEYGELFPPNLPSVCWIQDHLQNLMDRKAGASITQRDFVLTASEQTYHEKFSYPLRQCIYLNKATRVPEVPATWEQDGDTMVFVSNCSHDPNELASKLVKRIEQRGVADLVRDLCDRMIARYAAGGAIATMADLREALDAVEAEHRIRAGTNEQRDILLHALWHPFNDTLYRQQALRWAARCADSMGLTLALYGKAWDKNAEFSRFARGYAGYGAELEELTRRSAINLQIVPFACIHQRLLDGLVSGGFFLIREHPVNRIPADFTAFIETNFDASIQTTDAAAKSVAPELRDRFEELLAGYRRLNDQPDPVARVRVQRAVHAQEAAASG